MDRDESHQLVMTVSLDVLEEAGVSKRQYDQLRVLLKVDPNMFIGDTRRLHPIHYKESLYQHFVDFTKLPQDMPKAAKDILYRPEKVAKLSEVYLKIVRALKDGRARQLAEKEQEVLDYGRKIKF